MSVYSRLNPGLAVPLFPAVIRFSEKVGLYCSFVWNQPQTLPLIFTKASEVEHVLRVRQPTIIVIFVIIHLSLWTFWQHVLE